MEKYELYHYGIKGMRWGIRRFQNPDGSLTAAGKKRQARLEAREAKREAKREEKAAAKALASKMSKPIRSLSDTELKDRLKRLNDEKMALELEKRVSELSSKKTSAGMDFVKQFAGKAIGQAMIDGGKRALTDLFDKKFRDLTGLNAKDTKDAYDVLKKEVDTLNLLKQKKDYERQLKDDPDADLRKEVDRLNLQKQKKDYERQLKDDPDAELRRYVDRLNLKKQQKDYERQLKGEKDPDDEIARIAKRMSNEATIRRLTKQLEEEEKNNKD